jgi:protease II
MKTKTQEIKKEQEVIGGNYKIITLKNVYGLPTDGTIALFVVYRKGMKKDGKNPLPIFYGSYGHSMDAHFHQQDYHY